MIRELSTGTFVLGNRVLELANSVTHNSDFFRLAQFLQPELEFLAFKIDQTCKISILESEAIMVVAGAAPKAPHALSYTIGEYLPIHAGGASKNSCGQFARDRKRKVTQPKSGSSHRKNHYE